MSKNKNIKEVNAIGAGVISGGPLTPGVVEKTYFPDEVGKDIKTATPELHETLEELVDEVVNKQLIKNMGYEYVGDYKGLNTDTYVQKSSSKREKDVAHKVNKNLNRPSYKLNKQPPTMGSVSWDESKEENMKPISETMKTNLREASTKLSKVLEMRLSMIEEGLLQEGKNNGAFLKTIMTEAVMLYETLLREELSELDRDEFQQILEACITLAGVAGPTVKSFVLDKIKPRELNRQLMAIDDWRRNNTNTAKVKKGSMRNVRTSIAQTERDVLDATSRIAKLIMALNGVADMIQSGKIKLSKTDKDTLKRPSRLSSLMGRDPATQIDKVLKSYRIRELDTQAVANEISAMLPDEQQNFIRGVGEAFGASNIEAINNKMHQAVSTQAGSPGILSRIGDFLGKVLDVGMPSSGKTFSLGGGTFGTNQAY
jgi:hypothetical protein